MQDYEYKDEGGRFLCKLHHRLRCDECHYVSDLRDENKRYREALEFYAKRGHYIASGYPNTELQAIEYGEKARKALSE